MRCKARVLNTESDILRSIREDILVHIWIRRHHRRCLRWSIKWGVLNMTEQTIAKASPKRSRLLKVIWIMCLFFNFRHLNNMCMKRLYPVRHGCMASGLSKKRRRKHENLRNSHHRINNILNRMNRMNRMNRTNNLISNDKATYLEFHFFVVY